MVSNECRIDVVGLDKNDWYDKINMLRYAVYGIYSI